MTKILLIHFSQTGQLNEVVRHFVKPLLESDSIEVVFEELRPRKPFPFPWPFIHFFNTFPETVAMKPVEMNPLALEKERYQDFDLIVVAYQVWFLTPSLPISSCLQSEEAQRIFKDKPVVTVIACRNMWLQAQEQMKALLLKLNAKLIDNAVLIDANSTALSFISTPLWMLTGQKGPVGVLPAAGISAQDISAAERFGKAIVRHLQHHPSPFSEPMFKGLKAVEVNERLILSEVMARRGFVIWGKLIGSIHNKDSKIRHGLVCLYVVYLLTLILTFVPITAVLKRVFAPLMRQRIAKQKAYFSSPSGSDDSLLDKG